MNEYEAQKKNTTTNTRKKTRYARSAQNMSPSIKHCFGNGYMDYSIYVVTLLYDYVHIFLYACVDGTFFFNNILLLFRRASNTNWK